MLDNKWRHGIKKLEIPFRQPEVLTLSGIKPFPLIVDANIGPEIVLLITDSDAMIRTFNGIEKPDFYAKSGLAATSCGPVYWILFNFPNLVTEQTITYECVINPKSQIHMDIFKQLASQKYWHVIIANDKGEVVQFMEYENCYDLADVTRHIESVCAQIEVLDFASAKAEYERTYDIKDLLQA